MVISIFAVLLAPSDAVVETTADVPSVVRTTQCICVDRLWWDVGIFGVLGICHLKQDQLPYTELRLSKVKSAVDPEGDGKA